MQATEFDERFEAGEDMSAHVDWNARLRENQSIGLKSLGAFEQKVA